ncbi:Nonribosomal peptide synthetase fmpE [Fusarium oxysporum f. sp. albedinis]|nr:Nonribosomal peptide synthetase fmpE [Fusarium oxysporum f. sp. albedinis]
MRLILRDNDILALVKKRSLGVTAGYIIHEYLAQYVIAYIKSCFKESFINMLTTPLAQLMYCYTSIMNLE